MIKAFCITVLFAWLTGCGTTLPDTLTYTEAEEAFENGKVRLVCSLACSGAFGAARARIKSYYDQELWNDVAVTVIQIGYSDNLAYYYLGRSAEGLGYLDAARTYYKLSSTTTACDGWVNVCDGIDVPLEVKSGLERLPQQAHASPKVAEVAPAAVENGVAKSTQSIEGREDAVSNPESLRSPPSSSKRVQPKPDASKSAESLKPSESKKFGDWVGGRETDEFNGYYSYCYVGTTIRNADFPNVKFDLQVMVILHGLEEPIAGHTVAIAANSVKGDVLAWKVGDQVYGYLSEDEFPNYVASMKVETSSKIRWKFAGGVYESNVSLNGFTNAFDHAMKLCDY